MKLRQWNAMKLIDFSPDLGAVRVFDLLLRPGPSDCVAWRRNNIAHNTNFLFILIFRNICNARGPPIINYLTLAFSKKKTDYQRNCSIAQYRLWLTVDGSFSLP